MRVLMVTSEMVPLAKTGGLADAVAALAAELARQGNDVRVVMPRYYNIDLGDLERVEGPLGVPVGFGESWGAVYEGRPGDGEVPVYLLDNEQLFGRNGIYGTRTEPDFKDNVRRFTFLCRGALQLAKRLRWAPEVVHCHDWPTALVPVYLNTWERVGFFATTGSVLTIHNLGYQGIYDKNEIHQTQLGWEHFHGSGFEFFNRLNLLKAGLRNADVLTTVSPTYAAEIQTAEHGHKMDALLRHRAPDLFGVLNGMDYDAWNPEQDPLIPHHFSHRDLGGKERNRAALRKEFGLPDDPARPIVGMVSRLADQKGFPELCGPTHGSLYKICTELELDVVILGTGDAWCEEELESLASQTPNLKVQLAFDERKAHLIEAGSDFFLMPSRYEPCGLNQMYSLRYGTLPIVHRTGGLADTVEQYCAENGGGTGFVFDKLTPDAIFDSVGWAIWTWYNRPEHIEKMRKRAMQCRFSWEDSAARYLELYQWAIDRRLGRVARTE
ncbi:MAG: glycogen synthase GlgA [Thermoanaerobaculales bacterium]|nr:glycogen synthase GlgA [Thermoanaerobaculales bacterium]